MNEQYSEEKIFTTSDNIEESDNNMNDASVNPTHFSDNISINDDLTDKGILPEPVHLDKMTIPDTAPEPVENSTDEEPMVSRSVFYSAPMNESVSQETPIISPTPVTPTLLNHEESELFRARWNEIQGKFVDEPRTAVQEADTLVSELVEKITQMFTSEHSELESQWKAGDVVSTEDLRKALQHYRSFFNRLVG